MVDLGYNARSGLGRGILPSAAGCLQLILVFVTLPTDLTVLFQGVFDVDAEPTATVNRLVQNSELCTLRIVYISTLRGDIRQNRAVCAAVVYATIGQNACLEARPAVVHFGGFTVGSVHEQHIRLCNTSSTNTGMQVVSPTTPYFKVGLSHSPTWLSKLT